MEESYSLVTTAWEDRMDMFMKHYRKRIQTAEAQLTDGLEKAVIQGKVLRVEVEKIHFVFVFMMQRIHRSMRIL